MPQALESYYEYRVKAGDSLSLIMLRFFDVGPRDARYHQRLKYLLGLNPHIKDPNLIRAGSMLRLGIIPSSGTQSAPVANTPPNAFSSPTSQFTPAMCPVPSNAFISDAIPPQDEPDYWALSWLAERSNYLTIPGSFALGAKGNLLSPGNIGYIEQIGDFYADYKAGRISKGQYDYLRKTSLDRLKNNIGPFDKWLLGNKTPHEAIRIARGGGVPATANIVKHSGHLKKLAAVGKSGGYALAGVGVAASCMQIADTADRGEKNEIFVETVTSTGIGLASGALVGLFLVSNPVGWGTALVLAAGSVAFSYSSGKLARNAYDLYGNRVDLVDGMGIDRVCRQR